MNVLVFGASGRLGRRLCACARRDGHSVTAFVRDAGTAPANTAVHEGEVTDADDVAAAVDGHDAVCSAVGPDADGDSAVLAQAMRNVVTEMETVGVDRLVAVAAAGILQATPTRLRLETDGFSERLLTVARAHREAYETLRSSSLTWTLVCPPSMPDGGPTNHYRTAVDYLPDGGQSISTGDVAAFVTEAVANGTYGCQRVGIAY